jgi:hypothetical protein
VAEMAERRPPKFEIGGEWVELNGVDVPSQIVMTGEGLKGAPDLTVEFAVREGIPEVVGFHLVAKPTGRGIRTADLRAFHSLDTLAFNAYIQNTRRPGGVWFYDEAEYWRARNDIQHAQANQGTRARVSVAELEDVARVYESAGRDNPTDAVQVQLGYSRRTAERRIKSAREHGLLPAAKRGRP